jgi:UPF0716 protein FxsA
MNRSSLFLYGLAGWLAAEFVVFIAVAQEVGFGGALLLGCVTSIAGFALLRDSGAGAMTQLRRQWQGGAGQPGALAEELLRSLAGLLLILPGFLSDLIGLALAAPSVRAFISARFGGGERFTPSRPSRPGVVDLAPGEWISHDSPGR